LGTHENRVVNVNPRIREICDADFPGSTPASPLCVRGASTRFFDKAFVDAGFPIRINPDGSKTARLEQINMFTATNRSRYDSWVTTLRRRTRHTLLSASYVLSKTQAWGGQPTASYSGNGIAITLENQFNPEEFGPTRIDERHRVVASGLFDFPHGFQLAPIVQFATARPYAPLAGIDIDGDGRVTVDRICGDVNALSLLQARVAGQTVPAAATALGCSQTQVNSQRVGFVVKNGQIEERNGRFFNIDLRAQKTFSAGESFKVRAYVNFFNLLNRENLSFGGRLGLSSLSSSLFLQPVALYGPGFGPPVGLPRTVQLGARVEF
jgi:hypothetical protein